MFLKKITPLTPMCEGRLFSRYHLHYADWAAYLVSLNAGYVDAYCMSVLRTCPVYNQVSRIRIPIWFMTGFLSCDTFSLPAPKLPSMVSLRKRLPAHKHFSLAVSAIYSSSSQPLTGFYHNENFFSCQECFIIPRQVLLLSQFTAAFYSLL